MGGTSGTESGGVDRQQLLLVSLCMVALVVAAFLAPVSNPLGNGGEADESDPPRSGGGNATETGSRDGESGSGDTRRPGDETPPKRTSDGRPGDGSVTDQRVTARPGDNGNGSQASAGDDGGVVGGVDPIPIPGGDMPPVDGGCGVVVSTRPIPGGELTVTVYQDLKPATDTRVWFNDRSVGRTDRQGNVTGRVPYERSLNVTVENPDTEPCEFFRRVPESERPTDSEVTGTAPTAAVGAGVGSVSVSTDHDVVVASQHQQSTPTNDSDNSTGRYDVAGRVTLTVEGRTYAGSNVTVVATIEDVPMRQANVSVDGQRVGWTSDDGRHTLTLPDQDSVRLTVARGDFRAETTVDVLRLDVRIESPDPLLVPFERAMVNVTREGVPVENASVTLADERLGTTTERGVVAFELPPEWSATITASTPNQTARIPVQRAYRSVITMTLVLVVLAGLTTTVTAWRSGRRRAARVATGWAVIGTAFVAFAVGEFLGLALVSLGLSMLAGYRFRSRVRAGGGSLLDTLAVFFDWCRRRVVAITVGIERFVDWGRHRLVRLAGWLRSLPLSLSGLWQRVATWLCALPSRLRTRVTASVLRRLGVLALAMILVAGATVRWGSMGMLLASALLVAAAFVGWSLRRESSSETPTSQPASDGPETSSVTSSAATESTIRDLWRRLARWAVPDGWQTRTPAEISRAAIERGFPREPVEVLTQVFRDTEYGGHSSESRREQVREAYTALAEARDDEERSE